MRNVYDKYSFVAEWDSVLREYLYSFEFHIFNFKFIWINLVMAASMSSNSLEQTLYHINELSHSPPSTNKQKSSLFSVTIFSSVWALIRWPYDVFIPFELINFYYHQSVCLCQFVFYRAFWIDFIYRRFWMAWLTEGRHGEIHTKH